MRRETGFVRFAPLTGVKQSAPLVSRLRPSRARAPRQRGAARMTAGGSELAQGFALADAPLKYFEELNGDFSDWALPGAYAVRDEQGELRYVGYAKDVGRRLELHITQVPQQCKSFQTYIPDLPRGDVTPDLLEGVLEYWVGENGGMPSGNTVDRARWEGTGADRKNTPRTAGAPAAAAPKSRASSQKTVQPPQQPEPAIPVRERRTPRRQPSERVYRGERAGVRAAWDARRDDYVDMNVDPLDPFTATSHRQTTRDGVWDPTGGDDDGEDWVPIFGLVGVMSVLWLLSVLGNALPTASPSLGM